MTTEIFRLNLVKPLYYYPIKSDPFNYKAEDGEMIFCFGIDESAHAEFEPDRKYFPGTLIFAGIAGTAGKTAEQAVSLPKGNYMFAQEKKILNREEITGLAMEIQQELLWQRLEPLQTYFLRYVFEDKNCVTQIFRPCNFILT
jgi:hypothetical protein